jgi:AcrR family transcriptional regulator
MSSNNTLPWLEAGYDIFALHGPDALKVEALARKVGISKSSFYHHFADLEIYTQMLMSHHLDSISVMATKARSCKVIDPDFLYLMLDHKRDIMFNRRLRVHRDNLAYQLCFERASYSVEVEFIGIFAEMYGLSQQLDIAWNVLKVVNDLFYTRVTNENLTYPWLVNFLEQMDDFMKDVTRSIDVEKARKASREREP